MRESLTLFSQSLLSLALRLMMLLCWQKVVPDPKEETGVSVR